MAVPLQNSTCPFGIGRLTRVKRDGTLSFRWYSNRADNVRGTFNPGWIQTDGSCYYADRARHRAHKPFTSQSSQTSITAKQVIVHNFDLTDKLRIPTALLRTIAKSGWVAWEFEPSKHISEDDSDSNDD
jgi:hypothetical protein